VKFVSDGNFITTYDEDLEQAIIQSTNNKEKNNIVDIMTNEKLIKKNFTLNTNTIDDEKHIKFKPIDNEIRNNVFLLVIKKNKIERITFMNDFDQSVTMIFKDFEKNIEVLDSSFKIDIPENFDVIIDK
jgi:outer membrane lipoprotein-sorting protein